MINGTGSLSLRKLDLENQKIPAIGFTKTYFAHKATAGQTGFSLTSLTTPTEMSANGFSQPTTSTLTNAQLLFFPNNLKLISSLRGVLILNLSYSIATSTQINFIGFTAQEGEIFTGIIDYNAQTGIKVVDATAQPATGTLAANATTFNLGQSFLTNKYSSTQLGAVLVYLDGVLQVRNTGNSSVVLDGNYSETDNGSGSFSTITFNVADPVNVRNVVVTPNGLLSERPDGSMMAVIESVQGEMNNMAAYVAALAGQSTTTVLGAAPSNVDLTSFGNRVVGLEQPGSPGSPKLATSAAAGAIKLPSSAVQVDTGNGTGATNTGTARFTNNPVNIGSAITYADSAANGASFTINENGIYACFFSAKMSSAGSALLISKNQGSNLTTPNAGNFAGSTSNSAGVIAYTESGPSATFYSVSNAVRLSAGDVVRAQVDNVTNGDARQRFWITQVMKL